MRYALLAVALVALAGCSAFSSKSVQASATVDLATGLSCGSQLAVLVDQVKKDVPACFVLVDQVKSQTKAK